jgi:hypothetical protein
MLVWNSIDVECYISKTKQRIDVISLITRSTIPDNELVHIFKISNTKTRECLINNNQEWRDFIETCYSLSCEPLPDGWMNVHGRKKIFLKWMEDECAKEITKNFTRPNEQKSNFYKFDNSKFKDQVIVTLFDTKKDKRLIIDGLHRSVALTMACKENVSIPKMVIYECYGEQVDIIFPCDVHQL